MSGFTTSRDSDSSKICQGFLVFVGNLSRFFYFGPQGTLEPMVPKISKEPPETKGSWIPNIAWDPGSPWDQRISGFHSFPGLSPTFRWLGGDQWKPEVGQVGSSAQALAYSPPPRAPSPPPVPKETPGNYRLTSPCRYDGFAPT